MWQDYPTKQGWFSTTARRRAVIFLTPLLFLWLLGNTATAETARSEGPQINIVIDVSGSMRWTDPDNLRRPAMRILADLMPDNATSGIWFFGEHVTPMLAPRRADQTYRQRAQAVAGRIRSDEMFTDIAAALEAAVADWEVTDSHPPRHLIFLSDGMVDISTDDAVNVMERQRILDETIPMLQARRVRVHTISLSDEADEELLRALAERTDALFETMEEADRLQRAFLHLFEAAAPRPSLPLEDNRFYVDGSVTELTVLAFRADDATGTALILPDGRRETVGTAARLEDWRWDDEGGRDLVTITHPTTGEWRIDGALDPDNRAMIVTDLKMQGSTMPNRIYPGETVEGSLFFTDRDQLITRREFLDEMVVGIHDEDMGGQVHNQIALNDQGLPPDIIGGDGHFSYHIERDLDAGQYGFVAQAVAPTFRRQWRQNFAMAPNPPVVASASRQQPAPSADGEPRPEPFWRIELQADPTLIVPGSLQIEGELHCAERPRQQLVLAPVDDRYRIDLSPSQSRHDCHARFQAEGRMTFDRDITLRLPELALPSLDKAAARAAPTPMSDRLPDTTGIDWLIVAGANGLGGLLIGGTIWGIRRRHQNNIEKILAGVSPQ